MRDRPRKWCLSGYEWAFVIAVAWAVIAVTAA